MISRQYVGVDISKKWFDVCILSGKESVAKRYENSEEGCLKFVEEARALGRGVRVCMEHTGGYENLLAQACFKAGLIVSLVDGAKIKHYKESFGSAKNSTDKTCASYIAKYCRERKPERWFPVADKWRELRELVRHRQRLIESKTQWGCRISMAAENALVNAQRQSLRLVFQMQVQDVDKAVLTLIEADPELKEAIRLLTSIPGIAWKSATRILAESGPIESYGSAKEYALAAGLVPIVCHSGLKTPPGRLPVYGNKELRCALYFPAVVCSRHKIGVWPYMERLGAKPKMTLVCAGMRKLAHIVYGVLKRKLPFDKNMMG